MAAKLSGSDSRKAETLEEARRKWDHVRALVERVAAGGSGDTMTMMRQLARAATDVRRVLDNNGFSAVGHGAGELALVAQRAKLSSGTLRTMRDHVAGVRNALESAERRLHHEAGGESGGEE